MNIFEKRPLALILCVMLGGFSLFAFFPPLIRWILFASALSMVVFAFLIKRNETFFKILSIALLVSFISSYLYFEVSFYPKNLCESENEYLATVVDSSGYENGYQSITVKTSTVNSSKSKMKINLNVYDVYHEIAPGFVIKFKAKLNELEDSDGFAFKKYYTSRGICATADLTELEIQSMGDEPITYKFKQMRDKIARRAELLSSERAGSMLSALLLGERDRLSGQLNLDFARTGITHILALSGTHVVLLAAAVDKILSACRVGKKYRLVIGSVFVFLFMALTGFPFSVCRAGIMLIVSTVLFLLTGCKDSITSLAMASALIILISPYSSQDVGLWLSILATAGILISGEILNQKAENGKGLKRVWRYVSLSFIFSLFAISATVILSTLSFTGTSALSAIATFLFSILTELYVYLGVLLLVIGGILPIGKILIWFEEIISETVGKMSDLSFSYSSNEFLAVKIVFIVLGVSFAIFALAKIERKRVFLAYLTILFIFANTLPVAMTNQVSESDTFEVASGVYDKILVRTDKETTLLDVSNSSKNAAYENNYLLIKEKIVDLDYYVVLNYYSSLPKSLDRILSSNLVREVKLPTPRDESELSIALKVNRMLKEYRTEIKFYDDVEGFVVSDFDVVIPYRIKNMAVIHLRRDDEIYTYMSQGILEAQPEANVAFYVSDYLIFGGYGVDYSAKISIDEFDKKLKKIIIFDSDVSVNYENIVWEAPEVCYPKEKYCFYNE